LICFEEKDKIYLINKNMNMKNIKKIISLLLVSVLIFSVTNNVLAVTVKIVNSN
jgi:hypothetical protein